MATPVFRHLFSPIRVGKATLRNRIVFLPHGNNFPVEGLPGEREAYYFAERAKGGAALIIFGTQFVHDTGGSPNVSATNPKVVERYKQITHRVHQEGALICGQLMHRGSKHSATEFGLGWRMPSSASPWFTDGTVAREMDQDDIREAIEGYMVAARHMKRSGFDGIEIRLNSGLVEDFTSRLSNMRTDQYGGTLEGRVRLALEIIRAVRQEVGSSLIVGARVCVDEVVPGGHGVEEGQEIARLVTASGQIDYLNTSTGGEGLETIYKIGPYPVPQGFAVYAAAAVKEVSSLPVIAEGRINDPLLAEQILAEGKGDLIGMARGLIADPEFPNKAREGRLDDIRRCIGYQEVCQGRNAKRQPITCVWNPAAGREKELGAGTLKRASTKRKLTVIGGGPAGLKVAEVAARRGHQVTLYDAGSRLGGQINLAEKLPFRDHLGTIRQHLAHQIEKLGVEIKTGIDVALDRALSEPSDALIVATGSIPFIPNIPGSNQQNVVTYWDVARNGGVKGDSILIYDRQGFWPALGVAELLLNSDKKVHIVTPHSYIGATIEYGTLWLWNQRVSGRGLKKTTDATVKAIEGDCVTISMTHSPDEAWTVDGVDTVVLACEGFPMTGFIRRSREK